MNRVGWNKVILDWIVSDKLSKKIKQKKYNKIQLVINVIIQSQAGNPLYDIPQVVAESFFNYLNEKKILQALPNDILMAVGHASCLAKVVWITEILLKEHAPLDWESRYQHLATTRNFIQMDRLIRENTALVNQWIDDQPSYLFFIQQKQLGLLKLSFSYDQQIDKEKLIAAILKKEWLNPIFELERYISFEVFFNAALKHSSLDFIKKIISKALEKDLMKFPFLMACQFGMIDETAQFLRRIDRFHRKDFILNTCTPEGENALVIAAKHGRYELVKHLLQYFIPLETLENYHFLTAMYCLKNDWSDLVNVFFQCAKLNFISNTDLCFSASLEARTTFTAELFLANCMLNLTPMDTPTPLQKALIYKKPEIALRLLNLDIQNVSINFVCKNQTPPFLLAIELGDMKVIKKILEKGALINVVDDQGRNLFDLAAIHGHLPVLEYFWSFMALYSLKKSALFQLFRHHMSPSEGSQRTNVVRCAEFIIKDKEFDPHRCDENNKTALHYAVLYFPELVDLILRWPGLKFKQLLDIRTEVNFGLHNLLELAFTKVKTHPQVFAAIVLKTLELPLNFNDEMKIAEKAMLHDMSQILEKLILKLSSSEKASLVESQIFSKYMDKKKDKEDLFIYYLIPSILRSEKLLTGRYDLRFLFRYKGYEDSMVTFANYQVCGIHQAVMSKRCSFFNKKREEFPDVNHQDAMIFFNFVYSGGTALNPLDFKFMLKVVRKYKMKDVKKMLYYWLKTKPELINWEHHFNKWGRKLS